MFLFQDVLTCLALHGYEYKGVTSHILLLTSALSTYQVRNRGSSLAGSQHAVLRMEAGSCLHLCVLSCFSV